MTRRNGFPWGLALLGVGGYLLYRHYQQQAAPAVGPPATTVSDVLPSSGTTTTPAQLTTSTSDQQTVLQWAQGVNKPAFLTFAKTGDPNDLAIMARIITQEWNPGPCHTEWCNTNWAYLKTKYNLF